MAKILTVVVLAAFVGLSVQQSGETKKCNVPVPAETANLDWPDMNTTCVKAVKGHIARELGASLTYIAMGAHFLSANHFRPGVAKMFLKHAGEEREHARALIDYLLLRGETISQDEIPTIQPMKTTWEGVYEALTTTLEIEKDVRNYFKDIITVCEAGEEDDPKNDYHISDFLTSNFLDEQIKGVHEIANLLVTLDRLRKSNGNNVFAEFEFDRTFLKEE